MSSFLFYVGALWTLRWIWLWLGWQKSARNALSGPESPVTVIVAAHNEEVNLPSLLSSLSQMRYSDWEMVLVLDRCEDQSKEVALSWQKRLPMLRIVEIVSTEPGWSPKKWAIRCGIEEANHENLAFTDADCRVQPDWLRCINAQFRAGAGLVLGIGLYDRHTSLLNFVIQAETAFTAFQYIGEAGWGRPYMGVGRNLAYQKSLFMEIGGFSTHQDVLSGDDDLLVQSLAMYTKSAVMKGKRAATLSVPKQTWSSWWRQKSRHVSSSRKYSLHSQAILAAFHLLHGVWWILVLTGLLFHSLTFADVFSLYLWRIGFSVLAWAPMSRSLNFPWWGYPALDLIFFLYNLFVIPWGLIRRPAWT
ncbi:MAG: glycosyltransferase [Bacteroidia bacterium]|nr:glycosyltransferase [Bacteroidia bacterium]